MNGHAEREALKVAIADGLAGRAYPGDDDLGINTPNCEWCEGVAVARQFPGRDRRDLGFDHMLAAEDGPLGGIPAFMTVAAFAYYLPAVLTMNLDVNPNEASDRRNHLFTFATSVCFRRTAPDPDAPARQYDLVKDMPAVPADANEALRNPTPETRASLQTPIDNHRALVDTLKPGQRAAVAADLDCL